MAEFTWHNVRKWIGLFVTLPLSVVCGFDLAFTVYAVPLKETFNYTQTEVEIVASAGIIGFGFSIIQPSMVKLCGVYLTYIISGLTGSTGLLLLWLTCLKRHIFRDAYLAVTFFQLLACSGIAIAAALTASISVSHFDLTSSGKIVATYAAMYALGKIFFIYLYECSFQENDDLGGFFLATAIIFVSLMVLCGIFHVPSPPKKNEEISLLSNQSDDYSVKNTQTIYPLGHIVSMLKRNSLFHLTFWPAALIYSLTVTIMNNLTTIVPPSKTSSSTIITIFSLTNALVRVCVGTVLDMPTFSSVKRKLFLKLGFSAFFVFVMAVYLIWIDSENISIVFSIGAGASIGALFVIPVAMITIAFGKAFYSFTFGLFFCTAALSVLVVQIIVGVILDQCLDGFLKFQPVDNCFFWPFFLIIGIALFTIVLIIGNICYQTKLQKKYNANLDMLVDDKAPSTGVSDTSEDPRDSQPNRKASR